MADAAVWVVELTLIRAEVRMGEGHVRAPQVHGWWLREEQYPA